MKVVLFHGTGDNPSMYWFPWLKAELEAAGHQVQAIHYEDMNRTPVEEFLPKVLSNTTLDEETVLVGHSSGGPLILSLLEQTESIINKAVLVAGFCEELPGDTNVILQPSYNWATIGRHARNFVFINSDNDPWHCDDKQGRKMFNQLGGTLVIRHDGHFGSSMHKQDYKQFPLLKAIILEQNL